VTLPSVLQTVNQINDGNCCGTLNDVDEIHEELNGEHDNSFLRFNQQENIPLRNNRKEKTKVEPQNTLTLKRRRTTR
jgi:hypothetical protein